ncbi:tetratricopeptide repeat protein [Bacteroides congonensis]|uniref:tetratricopeptide repeat protein n=2 Tax=Bacteroides congonensis TaxID=1871006 RepID=UPI00189FDB7D|nr:tetratricopeptide repeat protein [Bacteroides congonensis]
MKIKYFCSRCHWLAFCCLFVGIGSILSSISFSSCSSSVKNPLLLCADSLMEARPDSALFILESISSPQKLPRADRALYALLLTQAKYKNYIVLEDDSLIKTAVEYYGDRKKSLYAAKAHYYWGATYRDMGYTSFAVEEYLTAIRLMPVKDDFLAMIYDNLAECYEEDELDNVAMDAYRKAYQILKGKSGQAYPLRGIARMFLLQNRKDSALCYYQQALDCALEVQDSDVVGAVYHDFAIVYNEKKDYVQANKYVSKAIAMMDYDMSINACLLKAKIMLNLNMLDSASYFFNKDIERLDIYGKAICYNGMYQIAKKREEWKTATESMDVYKVLYDSIQVMTDNKELNRLMDKHQLEEHKRVLSEHTKMLVVSLAIVFVSLMVICVFCFMWNDRKRKKRYIALQQELTQKRVDTMLLKEEISESNKEDIDKKRSELTEQQIQLCISMLKTTNCYDQLEALEKATPKQLLAMRSLRKEMRSSISRSFVDVMENLQGRYPALTGDDVFYCVLSLLCCSKSVIMELMDATSDALKTRKSRIKNKVDAEIFDRVFGVDNQ